MLPYVTRSNVKSHLDVHVHSLKSQYKVQNWLNCCRMHSIQQFIFNPKFELNLEVQLKLKTEWCWHLIEMLFTSIYLRHANAHPSHFIRFQLTHAHFTNPSFSFSLSLLLSFVCCKVLWLISQKTFFKWRESFVDDL